MTTNNKKTILNPQIIPVAKGWARNSINTTIFHYNSIISH